MRAMNSRCGRRRPRRVSLPAGTTGADYDTKWADPNRHGWRGDVDGPMRLAVAGLASPDRQGADRLLELRGAGDLRPTITATSNPTPAHVDPRTWRHKIVVGAAADYFFGIIGAMSALGIGAIPIERAKTGARAPTSPPNSSTTAGPRSTQKVAAALTVSRSAVVPYLAARAGVPVVPVHVAGTGRILQGALAPARATPR